ncbi:MAG: hypothetical protein JWM11_858 [Planctomycetaceae bacterium]|nr:hypothetical protein [Planctomycetaceae bacterium]
MKSTSSSFTVGVLTYLLAALCSFEVVAQDVDLLSRRLGTESNPQTVSSNSPDQQIVSQSEESAPGTASIVGDSLGSPTRLGPGEHAILGSGVRPQQLTGSKRSTFKVLRYDEDYSHLCDPCEWTHWWDPIKYIPLDTHPDHYLSLGGESRERIEIFHNPGFGAAPANSQGDNYYFTQRYMLHADLHLGQHLRFFTQTVSGLEDGAIGGPRPEIDVNDFGFHQAFVDLVQSDGNGESDSTTWRIGRQEMNYGSGRLIDVREGVNLRQSFDAVRFLARKNEWAVDGFWSRPVLNRPEAFEDIPDPQRSLWGLYAVHPLELLPDGHADLYYLGYTNGQAQFNQGAGNELRHTVGTRLWGAPMPVEYNIESMFQFGQYGSGSIQAWSIASAARYNFSYRPLKPRVGLRADIASGDRNANSSNLQSFNPLFPSGAYFNLANPVGPINMIDLHPTLDLTLSEKLSLSADWTFFWRESLGDGVYSLSGRLLRPAGSDLSRYIGSTPSLTMVWAASQHVTLLTSYVHVFPGPFIKESPPSLSSDYFTAWVTYKF